MTPSAFPCAAVLVAALGCASTPSAPRPGVAAASPEVAAPVRCDPARDRAAIRAMAGEFRVAFAFAETEVLAPGYERHAPYRTGAREVVELVEDSDDRISLQHVLVVPGPAGEASAMRHWRQDWTFADRELVEYRGASTWERRSLSADEVRCTWSQAVYGVTDEPRYESVGRWAHDGGTSTWTSQETWRPLPRREYTHRSDYDVLVAVNRHVVTDAGWVHEQDNTKLVTASDTRLVRERGENRYVRTELPEAALARAYLHDSEPLWQAVRAEWTDVLATHRRFTVQSTVDGKALHELLFPLAAEDATGTLAERQTKARAAIGRFVTPAP